MTAALVTAPAEVTPEIVVGPVAVNVKAETAAVPPLTLLTVLESVRCGVMSALLMVQDAVSPSESVNALPERLPPVQLQAPAK